MEPGIEKLYIEPTSACNLSCGMCFRHSWIDEGIGSMSRELVQRVLEIPDRMPSLKTVMFSGMGEPLAFHRTPEMVAALAARGLDVQLLTNGTLLTSERSRQLVEGGLSMLWVSVDGFQRSSYEKVHIGSQFDKITENLRHFNKVRGDCKLGITFVIMEDNRQELAHINAFADEYGVDCINLSFAVPSSPLSRESSCYYQDYIVGKQSRVAPVPPYRPKDDYCPFVQENGCFVKWNGDVVPCMQLLHSSWSYFYEEKRKVLCKSYGNLLDSSIDNIWFFREYVDFRRRVKAFEFPDCTICMGCEDRKENQTDCMFNTFPTCGACLWAQGVGRCP